MKRIESAIQRLTEVTTSGICTSDAFYELCWVLITASTEELKLFCSKYWASFDKVPTTLIVMAARVLANSCRGDEQIVTQCKAIIALYCDPGEEEVIIAGL
jgi:hypothetical protein